MIGHVSAGARPAATLLAGIDVSVVERINDQSVAQTVIALSDAMQRVVVDADGDGIAEGVSLTLRLEAPVPVPVSINARRDFEVVVRHSDGINTVVLGEQRFVVKRRETSGEGRWVAVVGSDSSVFTDFCRQQSKGLSPKLTLLRNGVALGADALAGQKEWKIEVEVEFDVVDGSGNPVRNPDGTVKKKVVKVVIVFNPQRDANGSGSEATGEDKGEGPRLVVMIGQCGATAANGNNGNGGKATAKVTGPGSLGVAVGGDGASNTDATVNKDGGQGGDTKVEAGNKRRAVGQPGATGVAIGGNGGGAVAPNTNPGDGGDADAEAPAGAASGVVIRPGDSGKGTLPGRDHETKSGTGTAKNGDTIRLKGKQEVGAGQAVGAKGQGGKAKAGVARAESGKAPKRSEPDYEGNPTTGN